SLWTCSKSFRFVIWGWPRTKGPEETAENPRLCKMDIQIPPPLTLGNSCFWDMFCAKCHKKVATVHFTSVRDGKAEEIYLCSDCASACGLNIRGEEFESWDRAWEEELYRKAAQIMKKRKEDGGDEGS